MNKLLLHIASSGRHFKSSELPKRQKILSVFGSFIDDVESLEVSFSTLLSELLETLKNIKKKQEKDEDESGTNLVTSFFRKYVLNYISSFIRIVLGGIKDYINKYFGWLIDLLTNKITKFTRTLSKFVVKPLFLLTAALGIYVLIKGDGSKSAASKKQPTPKEPEYTPTPPSLSVVPQPELPEITAETIQMAGSDPFKYSATPEQKEHMRVLAEEVLTPLQEEYGKRIEVTSGFRSAQHNVDVGGSKKSYHLQGYAADITAGSVEENRKLFVLLYNSGKFSELIWENGGKWVHVAYTGVSNVTNVKEMYYTQSGESKYRYLQSLSEEPGAQNILNRVEVSTFSSPL